MRVIRNAIASNKLLHGFTEGGAVSAATLLATDALVTWNPWFEPRKDSLYILVGSVLGSLVSSAASRFLWRSPRG